MEKLKIFIGLVMLALLFTFNVRHALNDYGISDPNNELHPEVLAQTNTPLGEQMQGGGSSGNGGGSSGGNGGGTGPSGCPLSFYNVNVMTHNVHMREGYVPRMVEINGKGGFFVNLSGRVRELPASLELDGGTNMNLSFGITLQFPDCVSQNCNVCIKTHIDKRAKIL
jgi:hypothetical protein